MNLSDMPDALPPHGVPVGVIIIEYWLTGTGEPMTTSTLPDIDDVPVVVQLGMLELAKEAILNHDPEEDE